jgi:hypothetical protein
MANRETAFQSPQWDSEDSANLRAFLQSATGRRFTFRLINERPGFIEAHNSKGDLIHQRAMEAAEIKGYELAVANVFDFVTEQVADGAQASAYPALDDESLWDAALTQKPLPEPQVLTPEEVAALLEAAKPPVEVPPSLQPLPEVTPTAH